MQTNTLGYNIKKFIVFFLIFFLSQALIEHIRILGIAPNLMFALIMAAALCENTSDNLFFSIFFGILYDFANGVTFGAYTVFFVVLAFIFGILYHTYFEDMTTIQMLLLVLSTLIYEILAAFFISYNGANFFYILLRISLIEFVYNSISGIIMISIYKKITAKKKVRFRGFYG